MYVHFGSMVIVIGCIVISVLYTNALANFKKLEKEREHETRELRKWQRELEEQASALRAQKKSR